jgi:hypothetical protein
MSSKTTMSDEQANFFRAELARTPAAFIPLSVEEIEAELDRRWKQHNVKGDTFLFDEKLDDADAATNGVVYCGEVVRGATTKYMYKPGRVEAAAAIAGGKRKRDEQSTPPKDTSSQASSSSASLVRSLVNMEFFLGLFKKDTLQNMCEDLDIPVSGNKADIIARIIKANPM